MKKSSKSGFTLIELIIVITIIGVLTALILPNFMAGRIRARDTATKSDMRSLKQAMQMFYNDAQAYPSSGATVTFYNNIPGCDDGTCVAGDAFTDDVSYTTTYMKKIPNMSFRYYQNNTDDAYVLRVELENASDADLSASQSSCSSSCPASVANCCTPSSGEAYYCACPD